jgi:membrane protein
MSVHKKLRRFFNHRIWLPSVEQEPILKRIIFKIFRYLYALWRDIEDGQLGLYAMSLVYTTVLSLVPLLAVSFSVLTAFGVHNQLEPILLNFLQPLGAKGQEITHNVINFVENINARVLGGVGLAILFYTVVATLAKIETAFNYIWRQNQLRPFLRRFADYISVLLLGPVLVFAALGLTASMESSRFVRILLNIEELGLPLYYLGQLMPYVLIIIAFTFVYLFMPNTKVSGKAAISGAVIAGILWKTAGWAFALFVANSANYDAIYSSFAILIFFIVWLELSWLILLLGAQLAFYFQNPQFLKIGKKKHTLNPADQEMLGLVIMRIIIVNFVQGNPSLSVHQLATSLNLPNHPVEKLVSALVKGGILTETTDKPHRYLPAINPEKLTVYQIVHTIRHELKTDIDTSHIITNDLSALQKDIEFYMEQGFSKRSFQEFIDNKPIT